MVIHQKGAPLINCVRFVDGTVLRISRAKINQNIVYNGHKQVHGIKFQSLAQPKNLVNQRKRLNTISETKPNTVHLK